MGRMKAIAYTRVSTAEQLHGYGLEVQEAAIRDHARQHDLRIVAVLADEGESGSNGLDARRGLAEAVGKLEAGEAEVLLVARLDRLARDLVLAELTIARLRERGIAIVSASEPDVDSLTDDPTRVMVRQILGAIGQYERMIIRGRMAAGKAIKASRGGYTGGQPGYGQRAQDRELAPNPDEQRVVELVTERRQAGHSYREICQALEAEGLRPRRAPRWQPGVVRSIAMRAGV